MSAPETAAVPEGILGHHFSSLSLQNEAVRLGMWLFLPTDILLFVAPSGTLSFHPRPCLAVFAVIGHDGVGLLVALPRFLEVLNGRFELEEVGRHLRLRAILRGLGGLFLFHCPARGRQRLLRPEVVQRPDLVIATLSWIDAGKVDYALGGSVPVLCLSEDPRGFAFIRPPSAFAGGDALIVAPASRPDWRERAAPYFQRIEPGQDVVLRRAGAAALTLHTALAYGLRDLPRRPGARSPTATP